MICRIISTNLATHPQQSIFNTMLNIDANTIDFSSHLIISYVVIFEEIVIDFFTISYQTINRIQFVQSALSDIHRLY